MAAAATATTADALTESLRLLKGESDEHKFAGLWMAAKYLKSNNKETTLQIGNQIVDAAGVDFMIRLMGTEPTKETECFSEYQELGATILSGYVHIHR